MSWHTSAIFIQQTEPDEFGTLLARLGFPGNITGESISFEDATSIHAPGKSAAHVEGWTVICDPLFFLSLDSPRHTEDQLWSPTLDEMLRQISAEGSPVFGFITEGGSGTHGFTLYRNGNRERMWLVQGNEAAVDEGVPLPEEQECFGNGGPLDAEQGLLLLTERLCVPVEALDRTKFLVFSATGEIPVTPLTTMVPPRSDDVPMLTTMLRNADPMVCIKAAFSLAQIGATAASAIPVMIELLESDEEMVRGYIAMYLRQFGPLAMPAVPSLIKLLNDEGKQWWSDKKYPVRLRAALAIAKIDPDREELVPVLRQYIKQRRHEHLRKEALSVLPAMGQRAQVFLPELKAAEKDPDLMCRAYIQLTLSVLDTKYMISDAAVKQVVDRMKQAYATPEI
jgi:hypothetical protein